MASLPDLVTRLRADTSNFQKGMKGAQGALTAVAAAAVAAGAAVAVVAAKKFIEFDDAMRATQATTGEMGQAFEAMTIRARELGASTSFTAVEVAQLMTELGRAGFKSDAIVDMTDAVLNLARATGTEASQAAGIMGATIRQFSLGAGDATRVADVLTHTANSTFNTVEQLGEAMKFAGPAAQDLGVSLEDTVAAVGMLGNIGIQGTMAGTAIRRLAVKTGAEAKKMEDAFGFAFTNAAGEARPLLDNLEDLGKSLSRMTGPERMKALSDAFGLLGVTSASALGRSAKGAKELAAELKNLRGTAKKAADLMDAGLGGATRRAMSAFEGLKIQIGEELAPAFTMLAEASSAVLSFLIRFSHVLVPLATGIVAVSAAWLAYVAVTKIVIPATIKVLALLGPKGWAILAGAAAAIAATTWALSDNGEQARQTAKAQGEMQAAQESATASAEKFQAAQKAAGLEMKKNKEAAVALASALQGLESPQETLNREIEEFKNILAATKTGIVWDDHPLVNAMRQKKSGFSDTMQTIQDDLRVLRGEATETAIELERMLEGIAPQDQPEIAAAFAERERLQQQQEAAEYWKDREAETARKKDAEAAAAANQRQRQITQNPQSFAGALQKGSADAFALAVRASTGKDSPVKEQKKTNTILRGMSKVMERQKERNMKLQEQPAV
jgi:TP901 family phage tail tape measure protein